MSYHLRDCCVQVSSIRCSCSMWPGCLVGSTHTAVVLLSKRFFQRYQGCHAIEEKVARSFFINSGVLLSSFISGAAVPHKVYPQASMIVSSIVSGDGSLLAVGLQSGVVLIWNQRTGYSVYTQGMQEWWLNFCWPSCHCRPVLSSCICCQSTRQHICDGVFSRRHHGSCLSFGNKARRGASCSIWSPT